MVFKKIFRPVRNVINFIKQKREPKAKLVSKYVEDLKTLLRAHDIKTKINDFFNEFEKNPKEMSIAIMDFFNYHYLNEEDDVKYAYKDLFGYIINNIKDEKAADFISSFVDSINRNPLAESNTWKKRLNAFKELILSYNDEDLNKKLYKVFADLEESKKYTEYKQHFVDLKNKLYTKLKSLKAP